MTGYDSVAMSELIQSLGACPEEESVILSSICNSISDLQVDESSNYDFRPIRIDWCRLQAYMSCGRGAGLMNENRKLAQLMNTLVFHTRMVDWLDQMLMETSDLSVFCFYTSQFERWFQLCMELPSQARFLPAFPLICSHFTNSLHQLCPEERQHIGERSLTLCNLFLDEMAKEARNVLTNIAEIHCVNADKLLPKYCAKLLAETVEFQRKTEKKSSKKGENQTAAQGAQRPPVVLPGQESERRSLQEFATIDKLQFALTELCCAINYCRNSKITTNFILVP